MTVYHVRPRDDGQWEVKKRGASRASFVGGEVKAKSKADKFSEKGDTVVLHNDDGSVYNRRKVTGARERNRKRGRDSLRGGIF